MEAQQLGVGESVCSAIMAHGLVWMVEPNLGLAYWEQARSQPMVSHRRAFEQRSDLDVRERFDPSVRPAAHYLESRRAYYGESFVGDPHESAGEKPFMLNSDGVAQFDITGPMTKDAPWSARGTSTVYLRRMFALAERDPDVKGAVIKIDSPGGSVAGTDDLARAMRSFASEKPLYAFAEDFMASAAYWAGCSCTKIFATPTTHIGSIGTILIIPDMSKMADKMGVEVLVFTNDGADYKGAGAPGTAVTDKHKAYFRSMVNDAQKHFTRAVIQGRGVSADQIRGLAGRMFIASEARQLGLIDGIASHEDIVRSLAITGGDRRARSFGAGGRTAIQNAVPAIAARAAAALSHWGMSSARAQAALLSECASQGIQSAEQLAKLCEEAEASRGLKKELEIKTGILAHSAYGPLDAWRFNLAAEKRSLSNIFTQYEMMQIATAQKASAQVDAEYLTSNTSVPTPLDRSANGTA